MSKQFGWILHDQYEPNVTHVLMSPNKSLLVERTVKYFYGILNGVWVLDFDWVKSCFLINEVIDEEPFEIKGDTFQLGAPTKGRNCDYSLFHGLYFVVDPRVDKDNGIPPLSTLEMLIKVGGGNLFQIITKSNQNINQKRKKGKRRKKKETEGNKQSKIEEGQEAEVRGGEEKEHVRFEVGVPRSSTSFHYDSNPSMRKEIQKTIIILGSKDLLPTKESLKSVIERAKKENCDKILTLSAKWLLDSISTYDLCASDDYKITLK